MHNHISVHLNREKLKEIVNLILVFVFCDL